MSDQILHTGAEWSRILDVQVLDPDGWRHNDGVAWFTPITEDDFKRRVAESTVQNLRKDFFKDTVLPPTKIGSFIIAHGVGDRATEPLVPLFLTFKGWMNTWGLNPGIAGWTPETVQKRGFTVVYDAGAENE